MNFDFKGYPLKFIQRQPCNDSSAHNFTLIYKFFSSITSYHYIVRAEYHDGHVFAIKFYCKKDRKSDYKYSKIVNKGDLGNILASTASIIPLLLNTFPGVSFVFAASRSVGINNRPLEDYQFTQRFKLYNYIIPLRFGSEIFEHISYPTVSCYMLFNKASHFSKEKIESILVETYEGLLNV